MNYKYLWYICGYLSDLNSKWYHVDEYSQALVDNFDNVVTPIICGYVMISIFSNTEVLFYKYTEIIFGNTADWESYFCVIIRNIPTNFHNYNSYSFTME